MQLGEFETAELAFVASTLRSMDLLVDVGANFGIYTCLARHLGREAIAAEPLPTNLALLYRNLEINGWGDTEVWPVALGVERGTLAIYGGRTGASLVPGWSGTSRGYRTIVSATTLDRVLLERSGQRMLIKVDVEGAEYSLLKGAVETLRLQPSPVWLMEICLREHSPDGQNPRFLETFETFWKAGYAAFQLNDLETAISPKAVASWVSGGAPPAYNFVFRRT
ncbi:MAG: FkbM family methyltransferase [Myxococcales bacterium]|nr:FkbM family methyltransferase [Myxococcales bacterium]